MFSATSARTRLTHSPLYPRCQRITMSGLTIASASRMNTVRIALRLLGARVHGTTGEVPIERFQRAKANALKSVAGIPPFHVACELIGRVQADCAVEIDGNAYSVPWRLIGETVRAILMDGVCPHPPWQPRGGGPLACAGQRQRAVDLRTSKGLPGSDRSARGLAIHRRPPICRRRCCDRTASMRRCWDGF
jgi:hypothetical protein